VEDFAALIDGHDCTGGLCSRWSHTQLLLVSAEDVATVADELRTLTGVRDCLTTRGHTMLETVPIPRFDPGQGAQPWPVKYVTSLPGRQGRKLEKTSRIAALRELFSQR
jgi:hypothetical protein